LGSQQIEKLPKKAKAMLFGIALSAKDVM